jgi:sugar lactone lactonase YvrE
MSIERKEGTAAPVISLEVVADGFYMPECPRWHDEQLFMVDIFGHQVLRIDQQGGKHVVHQFAAHEDAGGIGWLPDGRLLAVEQLSRTVFTISDNGASVYADLSGFQPYPLNDMIVAADGTAYVSGFGWDVWGGGSFAESGLLRILPDGSTDVAVQAMKAPNGLALTEGGDALYVAEPGGARLRRFTVEPDGTLTGEKLVTPHGDDDAQLLIPDGICLDDQGGLWAADPVHGRVLRLGADGRTDVVIALAQGHPLACVLGGPDRRTLFIAVSNITSKSELTPQPGGCLLSVEVDYAGAGRP